MQSNYANVTLMQSKCVELSNGTFMNSCIAYKVLRIQFCNFVRSKKWTVWTKKHQNVILTQNCRWHLSAGNGRHYICNVHLGVNMLVFNKKWQGIGESPVRNEFNREAVADTLSVLPFSNAHDALLAAKTRKLVLLLTCILVINVENTSIYGAKKNVDVICMTSQCPQENTLGYLWIPCEFYSSFADQIMRNKQSVLEWSIDYQCTKEFFLECQRLVRSSLIKFK